MTLPRSMSSLTLCSAWEEWETILLNPGRSKFNGIQTDYFSEFGQLLEFEWNIFQDSLQWEDDGKITV